MIVQPKQQNQPHREYLYVWYPEAIDDTINTTSMDPRGVYPHNGFDKDLLEQKSSTNGCKTNKDVENRNRRIGIQKRTKEKFEFFVSFSFFFYSFYSFYCCSNKCLY
jgi:hypothetical protein